MYKLAGKGLSTTNTPLVGVSLSQMCASDMVSRIQTPLLFCPCMPCTGFDLQTPFDSNFSPSFFPHSTPWCQFGFGNMCCHQHSSSSAWSDVTGIVILMLFSVLFFRDLYVHTVCALVRLAQQPELLACVMQHIKSGCSSDRHDWKLFAGISHCLYSPAPCVCRSVVLQHVWFVLENVLPFTRICV